MKIIISAGPTREHLDPIRFITNHSTGKMGYSIAKYALKAGHSVTLISGPVNLSPPKGVTLVNVETAEEMKDALVEMFPKSDALIMSAAVGDWKPILKEKEKIKRKNEWLLRLVPNPDILQEMAKIKREEQIVVGFALETENILANAKEKLVRKKLDMIVANTPTFFKKEGKSKVAFIFQDGRVEEYIDISRETTALKVVELLGTLNQKM
ncbi:phosphopantothenoylcysteine decarboxylase [bacterium]|nr:phosphopantothenoylcysteine decarboxylase [bacterium]